MAAKIKRTTVDLSAYPDLVVIYLGMRVNSLRGLKDIAQTRPGHQGCGSCQARGSFVTRRPDLFAGPFTPQCASIGLIWNPWRLGARSTMSHQKWWKDFLRDPGGTGFWHETYFRRGGFEAIYDDIPMPIGMMTFAPNQAREDRCSRRGKESRRRGSAQCGASRRNRTILKISCAAAPRPVAH